MSIRSICLLSIAMMLLCVGCVRIEETITLHTDGSGEVHMEITFPQLGLRWLLGKPNANWLRPNLPDGVRLTSFANAQGQATITDLSGQEHPLDTEKYEFDLGFDEITALNDIRIRPDARNAMAAAAGGTPGKEAAATMSVRQPAGPDIGPFQKLTLIEDGDLLHFRRVVQAARDPDDIEADMMSTPGSATRPQAFDLGDSTMKISIVCPGEVVDHNAHKVEGRTLTWEFNLKDLQEKQDRDWIVKFTCRRGSEK